MDMGFFCRPCVAATDCSVSLFLSFLKILQIRVDDLAVSRMRDA